MKLSYPKGRCVFHHPKDKSDFDSIFDKLVKSNENKDVAGVFTAAMQLIPTMMEDEPLKIDTIVELYGGCLQGLKHFHNEKDAEAEYLKQIKAAGYANREEYETALKNCNIAKEEPRWWSDVEVK